VSVVVRPAMRDLAKISLAGSLAVVRAIRRVTGIEAGIKWPNDVLLGGRKVAGVLVESSVIGDALQSAVLGIGLNVNLETEALPEISLTATSLHKHARGQVPRREILAALLEELDDLYRSISEGNFPIAEWRERLETVGREVRVRSGEATEEGFAEAVSPQGALLLRRDDGSLIELVAGEVTTRT
jgi:BirA family biotin operon repressor/biotin-[acetyl-CoA-carboxylase] ligase